MTIRTATRRPVTAALLLTAALAILLLSVVAPPARASHSLEVGMQDDRVLLAHGGTKAGATLDQFAEFGVDRIRTLLIWRRVAPKASSRQRPAGFDPTDPSGYAWGKMGYDGLISAASERGFKVLITISTPAPRWATGGKRANGLYKPSPSAFADFATAVAKRYGDRVDEYSLVNEPNQGGWLLPQSVCSKGHCTPYAPHHYRKMVLAAYPAIKAVDHDAKVLIGNTAPAGRRFLGVNDPLKPLVFLRAFGCVNDRFRPIRTGPCKNFKAPTGDGYAHHPYGRLRQNGKGSSDPDFATFSDTPRLLRTLDRLTGRGRIRVAGGGKMPVHYTELGYETRPPDPYNGYSPRQQKEWNQEVAYLSWRNPRIKSLFQYQYIDEAPVSGKSGRSHWGSWQSGLRYRNGKRKPAYSAFPNPIAVSDPNPRRGHNVTIWGQVRPGDGHTVKVQVRAGSKWRDIANVETTVRGYFTHVRKITASGSYRFTYEIDGQTHASDSVRVRVR